MLVWCSVWLHFCSCLAFCLLSHILPLLPSIKRYTDAVLARSSYILSVAWLPPKETAKHTNRAPYVASPAVPLHIYQTLLEDSASRWSRTCGVKSGPSSLKGFQQSLWFRSNKGRPMVAGIRSAVYECMCSSKPNLKWVFSCWSLFPLYSNVCISIYLLSVLEKNRLSLSIDSHWLSFVCNPP